jgi:hypothetical protein
MSASGLRSMGFSLPTTDLPWTTSSAARRGKAARPARAKTTDAAKRAETKWGKLIMGERVGVWVEVGVGVEHNVTVSSVVKVRRAASGRRRAG